MKQKLFLTLSLLLTMLSGVWADGQVFTYDPGKYHASTTVYVALQNSAAARINDNSIVLGAYIGGECRYEATATKVDDLSGDRIYIVKIYGDAEKEMNQPVTFHLNVLADTGGPGKEYILDDASVTFQGDASVGEPSNPKFLTFEPATVILPPSITVHRGSTVDLLTFINKEPGNGSIPVLTWASISNNFSIDGNNLTANFLNGAGESVTAKAGDENLGSMQVIVDAPATAYSWNDEYKNGLTANVGDPNIIGYVLANGYTLTPADATTTFTWKSSDETVVSHNPTNDSWTPVNVGTAVLTGTPNDGSNVTLTLTVKVVQPVTALNTTNVYLLAEVGEDITNRLNGLVQPSPGSATNKTLAWAFQAGQAQSSVVLENGKFIAKEVTGQVVKIVATTTDGSNISQTIYVGVVPVQPTSLTAVQETLFVTKPAAETPDIAKELRGNIVITPSQEAKNYVALLAALGNDLKTFVQTEIVNHPNREKIAATLLYMDNAVAYLPTYLDFTFTGHEGILTVDESVSPKKFLLTGSGSFIATGMVNRVLLSKFDDPDKVTKASDLLEVLVKSFTVTVKDGLGSFLVPAVAMVSGGTTQITLTEQPAGSTFDPDKISVNVVSDNNLPAGWVYATATRTNDASGLVYSIAAQSVGKGKIIVSYDGNANFGQGAIDVQQQLKMQSGWQWIAIQQGQISDLSAAFGKDLSEIRSQNSLIINDSQYGYFGDLNAIETDSTYKLRMKDGVADKTFNVANADEYLASVNSGKSKNLRKGWNWIGNPYQYYQQVSAIFGNTVFTEGDILKGKESFATYSGGTWTGMKYVTPGEGLLLYKQVPEVIQLTAEGTMAQTTSKPASARSQSAAEPQPWTFRHADFDDNMAMVAQVNGVDDASRVTLWAFVDDECRGRGEAIGNLQFITVHGNVGEKVTFRLYDQLTGRFHNVYGSRTLSSMQGTVKAPVNLYAGSAITGIDELMDEAQLADSAKQPVYDLQGRRVAKGSVRPGLYVKNGRKVLVKSEQ